MKSLILFDLHYARNNKIAQSKLASILELDDDFDALLLGGDNAELSPDFQSHRILFESLKNRFNCKIGFILGNHELWGKLLNVSSIRLLYEVLPLLGKEYGLAYLEQENLEVKGTTFVGTYGHFDYSFLRPGKGITMDNLLRGEFVAGEKKIIWKDRFYMDWEGKSDEEICMDLVKGFSHRLTDIPKRKISLSHTIPSLSLNGHPDSPEQYFMEAYSGSSLIGNVLEANGGDYHFCGHTHAKATATIGKTKVFNLGSDYDLLRYIIFSSNNKSPKVEEREFSFK